MRHYEDRFLARLIGGIVLAIGFGLMLQGGCL
jgi:hypothetical protein